MKDSIAYEKALKFSIRIVKLYKYLKEEKKEFVMSKQLMRCGTSVGANLAEARRGQSTKDFISKIYISLKESSETEYWLELLYETKYLTEKELTSIDIKKFNRILVTNDTNITKEEKNL